MAGNSVAQNAFCQDQVSKGYYLVYNTEQSNLGSAILIYQGPNNIFYYYYRKPIVLQYFSWITNIFTAWDWGTSSAVDVGRPAMTIIAERLAPTVIINVAALIVSLPLGFFFGIVAALHKNKPLDHFISVVVMIFISVPSFVLILLLMLWLGYNGSLPTSWPSPGASITQYIRSMVIPVFALSFGTIAVFTRYTRAELCEVMSSEFLLLARTKGLSRGQCITRHALRNSMVPIVPMVIGQFIGVLSGSVVLEQLYGITGIGRLYVECINSKDWNVLLVDMAVFTVIGLVANLFVDLSYGIVDPRIRMGAKAA